MGALRLIVWWHGRKKVVGHGNRNETEYSGTKRYYYICRRHRLEKLRFLKPDICWSGQRWRWLFNKCGCLIIFKIVEVTVESLQLELASWRKPMRSICLLVKDVRKTRPAEMQFTSNTNQVWFGLSAQKSETSQGDQYDVIVYLFLLLCLLWAFLMAWKYWWIKWGAKPIHLIC